MTESLFAFAFGIDVSRIEEIDAGFDGSLDELVGARLIDRADRLPEALTTVESHGAKAEG